MDGPLFHPIIVTKITNDKHAHLPLSSLEHILDQEAVSAEVFRTRMAVLATRPAIAEADSISALVKI